MAGPFAFIPDGMKQVCDPKSGAYSLVPMDSKNAEDLQKILDNERAKNATLQAEIEGLHQDLKDKETEILRLQAHINVISPAPKKRAA